MSILRAVMLGVMQGLTEFLPVSSSGHLVATKELLGVESPGVLLEVALHFGTLLAIVAVLRPTLTRLVVDTVVGFRRLLRGERGNELTRHAPLFPMAVAVVVGTVPAVVAGLLARNAIERAFDSMLAAGFFLICTGLLLLASRWAPPAVTKQVQPLRGLLIGVAQAFALLPGISRSGSTIVAARMLGVDRDVAGRFSFVLVIPAILGATGWQVVHDWPRLTDGSDALIGWPLVLGMLASAVTGGICLGLLLRMIRRGRLHWFAAYCIPAGLAMILLDVVA